MIVQMIDPFRTIMNDVPANVLGLGMDLIMGVVLIWVLARYARYKRSGKPMINLQKLACIPTCHHDQGIENPPTTDPDDAVIEQIETIRRMSRLSQEVTGHAIIHDSRTRLHEHPIFCAFLQIGIILAVYGLFFSFIFMPKPEEVSKKISDVSQNFRFGFNILRSISMITALLSMIGLLYPRLGVRKSWDDNTRIVIRWVTRGTSPDLIRANVYHNWEIIQHYENVKMEIVTDNKIGIQPEKYGIPKERFDELVVPDDYSTPNGSLFKARALCYAASHSPTDPEDYIVHCDEESAVTKSFIEGVKEFVTHHYGKIGQGVITYRNDEYSLSSYLCHIADSVRVGDDLGRFRFQFAMLGTAICGLKGSFVVCPNSIEQNHATSFDVCGPLGSITEDSWWAFTNQTNFQWCNGTLIEQSPFTIRDLAKQRKRWVSGLLLVLFYHPAAWYQKLMLGIQLAGWCLLPLLAVVMTIDFTFFGVSHYKDKDPFTLFAGFFGMIWIALYLIGSTLMVHKTYTEKVLLMVSTILVMPLILFIESWGIGWGLMYPDKQFGLVNKEGKAVKNTLKHSKMMISSTDSLL